MRWALVSYDVRGVSHRNRTHQMGVNKTMGWTETVIELMIYYNQHFTT
ncbi:MAG: hypothetical protein U9N46_13435 [Euryarchaeota archaeon]|nr:hypothetical protein [Euryarchaeota archaeon]